jgi:hypothetical protein
MQSSAGKTAVHEAGHAAAIYLGNKTKTIATGFFSDIY